jgi:hypothetical protein
MSGDDLSKKRIGFIYFDEIHHIHHFLGSFIELYRDNKYQVHIITYQGGNHKYLYYLLDLFNISKKVVVEAPTYKYRQVLNKIRKRKRPSIHFLFKKNRKLLSTYDVLVYNTARQSYMIKYRKGEWPKLAFLDHGAGDRNYIYNDSIANFDLVSVAGKKVYDMCVNSADFSNVNIKICGYQKFETVKKENKSVKLFNNDKPIVLYNPHFMKPITSYYNWGKNILDFFYSNDDYNLIFAPHLILFNRKGHLRKEDFDSKYLDKDNIYVDLGSENLVNMRYTLLADIYLGDVSSQVYEFLIKPRPCIFLNSHNVEWKDNKYYKNWNLGYVVNKISDFAEVLTKTDEWSKEFISIQKQTFNYTFDIGNITASRRISNEIIKLLPKNEK